MRQLGHPLSFGAARASPRRGVLRAHRLLDHGHAGPRAVRLHGALGAPEKLVYVALPIALAVVFQGVAHVGGATAGIVGFGAAGLACSAFLPLSISFGGAEFPKRVTTISGELIAIYQVGYGAAAFGVGPLRDYGNVSYATAFSLGSVVAAALAVLAWRVTRPA